MSGLKTPLARTAVVLAYAHWIVRPRDLSRLQTAFFGTNVAVGLILLVAAALDVALGGAGS